MIQLTALMVLITLGAIVLWVIVRYNALVTLRNQVENGWKQIDVQLKRRHDLIPNLVNTVKGIMEFEQDTLEKVVSARSAAMGAKGVADSAAKEGALTDALSKFFVVVEQYPQLRSSENVSQLQEELTSTENKISFSRQHYNDTVMHYNTRIQSIPTNIVAGAFRFEEEPFFGLDDAAAREAPKVAFS